MTIYINGKFLTQRLTGVQRYAYEITKALIASNVCLKVIVPPVLDIDKVDIPKQYLLQIGKHKNTILWEQLSVLSFLKGQSNYILLSLCNVGPLLSKNQIICIHDLAFQMDPKWFSKSFRLYYNFMIPRLAKRAKKIITVSKFSKKELSNELKLKKDEISVVYNAPADRFRKNKESEINFAKANYFLFVGSMHPRKNIELIIRFFSLEEFRDNHLIVVGAKTKSFGKVNLMPPPNVEILDNCSDDMLAELYSNARALINPSIYEGFGIPVVEAMSSGCPLILSNLEVFSEIAESGAVYFDPYSLEDLRKAFISFLEMDERDIQEIIRLNYRRSKTFSWNDSAQVLLNAISR